LFAWLARTWSGRAAAALALAVAVLPLVVGVGRQTFAQDGVWIRQFGSTEHTSALAVASDPGGNALVAGWTSGALTGQVFGGGPRDAFVLKVSRDNTVAWVREIGTAGSDVAMDVAADGAGDVYVVGQTTGALTGQPASGQADAFVRKYDPDGRELWTLQFGGGESVAARVAIDGAGAVYVGGWTTGALPGQTALGQFDAFLRKYDADGAELWTRQFGSPLHDRLIDLAVDDAGNGYVAAVSSGTTPGAPFVRKFDPNGTELWTHQAGAAQIDDLAALALDGAGNVYVAGRTGGDDPQAFLRKLDPNGTEVWTRSSGPPHQHTGESAVATDVLVDPSGTVLLVGHTDGDLHLTGRRPAGGFDVFTRAYNADGAELWTRLISTPGNEVASRLALSPTGDLYAVGWTSGTFGGQQRRGPTDAFVAKLV
jgi:hypothetical protein